MNRKVKITAQAVYNLQNLGVMNGNDMHDFFREVAGTPSPKGRVEIDKEKFEDFIASCLIAMHLNSGPEFLKTLMNKNVWKIFFDLGIKKMHSKAFKQNPVKNMDWVITDDIRPYFCDSAAKTKEGAERFKSQLRPELKKAAVIRQVNVRYVHVKDGDVKFGEDKRWGVLLPIQTTK